MVEPIQLSLHDAASPMMEELLFFHDYSMLMMLLIGTTVIIALLIASTTKTYHTALTDANHLEFLWTLLPVMILLFLATPSMRTLFLLENQESPSTTIKAIGHQWYWSYEYSDYENILFDSYMIQDQDLEKGSPRLLETDNRMVFPMQTPIRLLISAEDVLHSWTLPALGVKIDAVPGRLNQLIISTMRPGIFYGQCSEICGANHSFMPISTESVPTKYFEKWLDKMA
uniref:Cytochrome c oxidase subunit 2 n=1 Tax=Chamaeleo chamaeleon TaxID=91907 RepID=B7S6K9_CHACM|nr:cytochrome c oxidase subunit II [Chamaeleo chamaeleon]ABM89815.1 cytochrome c oxidase subunit II [Chamaeleo chamaeleon]ABM89828.1 cytochrome c oxidase subunit II [Chamaeleo chamaeleon]